MGFAKNIQKHPTKIAKIKNIPYLCPFSKNEFIEFDIII